MFGLVTRDPEATTDPAFDRVFYEVKGVSGRRTAPVETGVNMVSCHGDTAASGDPAIVPVDRQGRPATRERPYFDWGYACPTHDGYRERLFECIDECVDAAPDVRLDDVGFPRQEYCYCERCKTAFEESAFEDRLAWREALITRFVTEVAEHVPGRVYLTLYPDPYPGHLRRRTGLAPEAVDGVVDEFVVPLYDQAYTTTYWLEIIASGFQDVLSTPFSIELYAAEVTASDLEHATDVAAAYAEHVYFAYAPDTAREVLRRVRSTHDDPADGGDA